MNIIEKILKVHSVDEKNEVIPGDIVEVRVDKVIMLDMVSVHPEFMNNPPNRPFDVSKVAVIFDHYVPPPTIEIATNVEKIRKLVKTWGVKQFFRLWKRRDLPCLCSRKRLATTRANCDQ